jgi:hypothetical protein
VRRIVGKRFRDWFVGDRGGFVVRRVVANRSRAGVVGGRGRAGGRWVIVKRRSGKPVGQCLSKPGPGSRAKHLLGGGEAAGRRQRVNRAKWDEDATGTPRNCHRPLLIVEARRFVESFPRACGHPWGARAWCRRRWRHIRPERRGGLEQRRSSAAGTGVRGGRRPEFNPAGLL